MSIYELDPEDYELFENDEALDELAENDSESDLAERRTFRLPPVRTGKVAPGRGYSPPRPVGNTVTQAQFQAAMTRIGNDIRRNSEALKRVSAQVTKTNSQLAAANARQDKEISGLKKEVKEMKKQNELASLLPLLSPPKLTAANPDAGISKASDITTSVTVAPPDLVTLLLLGGLGGGLGGSESGSFLSSPVGALVLINAIKK